MSNENKLMVNNYIINETRKLNYSSSKNKDLTIYNLNKRESYFTTYIDFCLILFSKRHKKYNKLILLKKLTKLNEKLLSVEGLIKLHYDVATIKDIIHHNTNQDQRIFSIPSYNIYKDNKKEIDKLIAGVTNNYNIWLETVIMVPSKNNFLSFSDSVEEITINKHILSVE